ncbi:hypothetical protein ACE6H2_019924 [Prunus campanulata]
MKDACLLDEKVAAGGCSNKEDFTTQLHSHRLIMNHVVFWFTIDAWKEEGIQGVGRRSNGKEKKKSRGSCRTRRLVTLIKRPVSSWQRATFAEKEVIVPKRLVSRRSVMGKSWKILWVGVLLQFGF